MQCRQFSTQERTPEKHRNDRPILQKKSSKCTGQERDQGVNLKTKSGNMFFAFSQFRDFDFTGSEHFSEHQGECSGNFELLETVGLQCEEPPNSSHIYVKYLVNSCGHPCMKCLQANNIESSILTADHSYTKRIGPSTCSIGVNTDETMETTDKTLAIWPFTPIPKIPIKLENDIFDDSIASNSFDDDKNDLTFEIDRDIQSSEENEANESTDSDDSTAASDTQACITNQRKFFVFENQLDKLFARLKCDECNCSVDTKKDCSSCTIMRVSVFCTGGHLIYKWLSQPLIGNMPAGNLLVTAATMLCGQTYTHIGQFAEFMNLKFIGSLNSTPYNVKFLCQFLHTHGCNCNGDKERLEESWVSIVHHVRNQHTFEGKTVTSCAHEEITPDIAEKKRWFVKDSKAHNALKEVILING
ncbi:unnamed protein product [Mytilus coruscus]|uniref:THAP-type domain-containing protein n=1 Tax=Mytilus coruscus TaxID=42192 RepID=A0A6J8BUC9_MYTCO|nr:unnamed protein product [Mytilus coruscus]